MSGILYTCRLKLHHKTRSYRLSAAIHPGTLSGSVSRNSTMESGSQDRDRQWYIFILVRELARSVPTRQSVSLTIVVDPSRKYSLMLYTELDEILRDPA